MNDEFLELAKMFDTVAITAERLERAGRNLERQAQDMAVVAVHNRLMENLEVAISSSREYRHPALADRLREYFSQPYMVTAQGGAISINVDDPGESEEAWRAAQEAANEARERKRPVTKRQAAAYWRNRVYDMELYEPTLEERFAELGNAEGIDIAPFWVFLEYGTSGPLAYPPDTGKNFIGRTELEANGAEVVNFFRIKLAEALYDNTEWMIGDVFDDVPKKPRIAWSREYIWNGQLVQHLYDVETGYRVKGAKIRIIQGPP